MADGYLNSVPSDANPNDGRLFDTGALLFGGATGLATSTAAPSERLGAAAAGAASAVVGERERIGGSSAGSASAGSTDRERLGAAALGIAAASGAASELVSGSTVGSGVAAATAETAVPAVVRASSPFPGSGRAPQRQHRQTAANGDTVGEAFTVGELSQSDVVRDGRELAIAVLQPSALEPSAPTMDLPELDAEAIAAAGRRRLEDDVAIIAALYVQYLRQDAA